MFGVHKTMANENIIWQWVLCVSILFYAVFWLHSFQQLPHTAFWWLPVQSFIIALPVNAFVYLIWCAQARGTDYAGQQLLALLEWDKVWEAIQINLMILMGYSKYLTEKDGEHAFGYECLALYRGRVSGPGERYYPCLVTGFCPSRLMGQCIVVTWRDQDPEHRHVKPCDIRPLRVGANANSGRAQASSVNAISNRARAKSPVCQVISDVRPRNGGFGNPNLQDNVRVPPRDNIDAAMDGLSSDDDDMSQNM